MKSLKPISTLIILSIGLGLFQNCNRSDLVFEDKMASLNKERLNYRYTEKPSFYIEPQLTLDPNPNPGKNFSIKLFIGKPSESLAKGFLKVVATDNNDRVVCPEDTVDLSLGERIKTIHCVPPTNFSSVTLRVSVTDSDHDFSYFQEYVF